MLSDYNVDQYGQVEEPTGYDANYISEPSIKNQITPASSATTTPVPSTTIATIKKAVNPFNSWMGFGNIWEDLRFKSAPKPVGRVTTPARPSGNWFDVMAKVSRVIETTPVPVTKPTAKVAAVEAGGNWIDIFSHLSKVNQTTLGAAAGAAAGAAKKLAIPAQNKAPQSNYLQQLSTVIAGAAKSNILPFDFSKIADASVEKKANEQVLKNIPQGNNLQTITKERKPFLIKNIEDAVGMSGMSGVGDYLSEFSDLLTAGSKLYSSINPSKSSSSPAPAPVTVVAAPAASTGMNQTLEYGLIGVGALAALAIVYKVIA